MLFRSQRVSLSLQRNYAQSLRNTVANYLSLKDTIELLQGAFKGFSEGVNPVSVETMLLMLGDTSLQFRIFRDIESLMPLDNPFVYDANTKYFHVAKSGIVHYTLGPNEIVPSSSRDVSSYPKWDMDEFTSGELIEPEARYYLYARVSKTKQEGYYELVPKSLDLDGGEQYNLLVGILNAEYSGTRVFVPLYGYTAIMGGQINTDVIKSSDGQTYFDLQRGVISGDIHFIAPDGSNKAMKDYADEQKNEFSRVDKNAKNLQDQIDGVVENHFYAGEPSLTNEPTSLWVTDEQKINHIGDTYTDIANFETDPNSGKSWRWCRCDDMVGIEDYVEVTDKDGEVYKLHWHPIADTDAVKALLRTYELEKRVDDAEYLKDTFKKGSTEIKGGVVMSQMVAVTNENDNIEAFLNGSGNFSDVEHGKIILAGGIPSGETNIEERAKEAATIIYEDGTINTSKIIAKEGELSGFKFDRDYLSANIDVDDENGNVKTQQTRISPYEISIHGTEKQARSEGYKTQVTLYPMIAGMIPTATAGIIRHELLDAVPDDMYGYITSCATLILSAKGALPINSRGFGGNYSILSENGMFAGLRPRTFKHPDKTYTYLSTLDHTIISVFGDGNRWLYLPTNPENGQHYRIVKYGSHLLHVDSQESERLVTRIGVSEDIGHAFENAWVGTIEVTYCSEIGRWVMTAVTSY